VSAAFSRSRAARSVIAWDSSRIRRLASSNWISALLRNIAARKGSTAIASCTRSMLCRYPAIAAMMASPPVAPSSTRRIARSISFTPSATLAPTTSGSTRAFSQATPRKMLACPPARSARAASISANCRVISVACCSYSPWNRFASRNRVATIMIAAAPRPGPISNFRTIDVLESMSGKCNLTHHVDRDGRPFKHWSSYTRHS
jgi:hypothetical protein